MCVFEHELTYSGFIITNTALTMSLLRAAEIYRGPERFSLYRGFGYFCAFHSVAWFSTSYYFGWLTEEQRVEFRRSCTDFFSRAKALFIKTTADKAEVPDPVVPPPPSTPETAAKTSSLWSKIRSPISLPKSKRKRSTDTDRKMVSAAAFSFAVLMLAAGFYVPRRAVHRIVLLPPVRSPSYSTATADQLVEVHTYGGFGLFRQGVSFRTPLSTLRGVGWKLDSTQLVYFAVKGRPFPFFAEKVNASFPHPEVYNGVFAENLKY
ncbi:unnamed protein product [Dicrocoelium dendriticum]|nr:unnamed protein product [Dicrocoelium dendriticum]